MLARTQCNSRCFIVSFLFLLFSVDLFLGLFFQAKIVITWPFSYATANSFCCYAKNTKKAKKTLFVRLNGDGNCLKSATTNGTTMPSTSTFPSLPWSSTAKSGSTRKTIPRSSTIGLYTLLRTSLPRCRSAPVGKVSSANCTNGKSFGFRDQEKP